MKSPLNKTYLSCCLIGVSLLSGCSAMNSNSDHPYFSHSSQPLAVTQVDLSVRESPLSVTIHFENDRYELDQNARQTLTELSRLVLDNPTQKIIIQGHTDSHAAASYNMQLSKQRADQVRTFLLNQQLTKEQIEMAYFGENQPAASNTYMRGRALNRRSEIMVELAPDNPKPQATQ